MPLHDASGLPGLRRLCRNRVPDGLAPVSRQILRRYANSQKVNAMTGERPVALSIETQRS